MDTGNPNNPPLYSLDHRSSRSEAEGFLNDFPMRAFHAGKQLYAHGRHLHAIMALKYGLIHDPGELRLHMMLIIAYLTLEKSAEANRHLEILRRLQPSPENAEIIKQTIANWQYIPDSIGVLPVTPRNDTPYLSSSLFGIEGEFGNQIFQYAFGKLYSGKHGLQFETYDWLGRKLFGLRDAPVSRILPFILEIEFTREDLFSVPPLESGLCDRDAQGYFQNDTRTYAAHKQEFRALFKPVSMVEWVLHAFLAEVRKRGKTLVAIHLRRGDAIGQGRVSNSAIYVAWLREILPRLDDPILFLASDDLKNVRNDFAEFNPVTSEEVNLPIQGAGFYPDFYMLTQADYLAAGNSTFSFAASMLNANAKAFFRPDAGNSRLVPFDPWSANPCL